MRGRLPMLRGALFPIAILVSCCLGLVSPADVILKSLEIYKTHELLSNKLKVYFKCNGENKTTLPDVKEVNVSKRFNGEESWQPLTEFSSKKCKRCGFYEKEFLTGDDVFDEWEFCPTYFSTRSGRYTHDKEKEFNATFLCKHCWKLADGSRHSSTIDDDDDEGGGINYAAIIFISFAVTLVMVVAFVAGVKYRQKKKRQHEQARFLKLFEESDELEDELRLGDSIIYH